MGEISRLDTERGLAEVVVKNKFAVGDKLQMIQPSGNVDYVLNEMHNLKGQAMDVAPGGGHTVMIPWQGEISDLGLVARYL